VKSGRRVLFSLFLRVRFVSLSLSVSFPPLNETKCRERNSEDIPPTFCEVIDDAFADDAFADDSDD
jgi:hypothetical protein